MKQSAAIKVEPAASPAPLSPARQSLADHVKSIAAARTALTAAQNGLTRLQQTIEAETTAKKALQQVEDDAQAELSEWAASGVGKRPEGRQAERQAAEGRLEEARRQAEDARALDASFTAKVHAAVKYLNDLIASRSAAKAVMLEEANLLAARYAAALATARDIALSFAGLNKVLAGTEFIPDCPVLFQHQAIPARINSYGGLLEVVMFDLPALQPATLPEQLRRDITTGDTWAATRRWADFCKVLEADPAASLPDQAGA